MEELKEKVRERIINKVNKINDINTLEYIEKFLELVIKKWGN